ncbi:MAG: hypothetical protein H0U71_04925 [Gammaproteobacteria bacterium]|nr:hypothetical protein [Gammaproteobacteria bacterium]
MCEPLCVQFLIEFANPHTKVIADILESNSLKKLIKRPMRLGYLACHGQNSAAKKIIASHYANEIMFYFKIAPRRSDAETQD